MKDVNKEKHQIQRAQAELINLMKLKFPNISQDIIRQITSIHNRSTIECLSAKVTMAETLDEIKWEDFNIATSMEDAIIEQYQIQKKQEEVIKQIKLKFQDVPEEIIHKIASIHNRSTIEYLSAKVMMAETLDGIEWENFGSELPKFAFILEKSK